MASVRRRLWETQTGREDRPREKDETEMWEGVGERGRDVVCVGEERTRLKEVCLSLLIPPNYDTKRIPSWYH